MKREVFLEVCIIRIERNNVNVKLIESLWIISMKRKYYFVILFYITMNEVYWTRFLR